MAPALGVLRNGGSTRLEPGLLPPAFRESVYPSDMSVRLGDSPVSFTDVSTVIADFGTKTVSYGRALAFEPLYGVQNLEPLARNIWETAKFRELLQQSLGSPVELTPDEADEIIRLAQGRRPDLMPGEELVRRVRKLLGHSVIGRLRRFE